jgi:hypothetical protein
MARFTLYRANKPPDLVYEMCSLWRSLARDSKLVNGWLGFVQNLLPTIGIYEPVRPGPDILSIHLQTVPSIMLFDLRQFLTDSAQN